MEELREENAELREDNDKLVAYLESLERKKKDLEEFAAQAQGGGAPLGQHSCDQGRQRQWTQVSLLQCRDGDVMMAVAGVSAAGELGQFVQLKSDTRRLTEENEKLKKRLDDAALNSGGSYTTVPIPGQLHLPQTSGPSVSAPVERASRCMLLGAAMRAPNSTHSKALRSTADAVSCRQPQLWHVQCGWRLVRRWTRTCGCWWRS